MTEFTHFDEHGASRMVDVSGKQVTVRTAKAEGYVLMRPETLRVIRQKQISKGDVLEVARLAGIMATKRTDELIPLCHSLGLDSAEVDFDFPVDVGGIRVESRVSVTARTGVEMEALMAVSIAALTIYDMCKSMDRGMQIDGIQLLEKTGGRSGTFQRKL
jgi:cyclic pyranopterin monophosphate synthase